MDKPTNKEMIEQARNWAPITRNERLRHEVMLEYANRLELGDQRIEKLRHGMEGTHTCHGELVGNGCRACLFLEADDELAK